MIARLSRWLGGGVKVHYTTAVAVPKKERVSTLLGPTTVEVEGEWDTVPGVEIKLELWHPKSQRGRNVTLWLSVEEGTELLVSLREALRKARI